MNRKSPFFKILLNSILGLILLFIWSRFVNLAEIFGVLKQVSPQVVLLVFFFIAAPGLVRALRLKLFLGEDKIKLKDLIFLHYLSQLLSFFIPIRAGELTKSVYLTTQYNLPLAKTVVWIFLDRFLDFWLTLFLIIGLFMISPTNIPANLTKLAFILFVGFTVVAILIVKSERLAKNLVEQIANIIPIKKVRTVFKKISIDIIEGFEVLRKKPSNLLILFVLTVIATLLDAMVWVVIFNSINAPLDFMKIMMGNLLFALSFLIPAAPGYVGSVEAAGLGIFSGILGVDKTLASAGLVLFHIITIVSLPIIGLMGLYFLDFDLGQVWKKLRNK